MHWTRSIEPDNQAKLGATHVGLYVSQGDPIKKIHLKQISICDLPTVNALADFKLPAAAIETEKLNEIDEWRTAVLQATPSGVDPAIIASHVRVASAGRRLQRQPWRRSAAAPVAR